MKKFFRTLLILLFCAALVFLGIRFGPALYYRFFSGDNTAWISERFSEELKEKNELVVLETTLTGQEIAKQNAWLLGTVQEVMIPYSYSISFVVDVSRSHVSAEENTITIFLPLPQPNYSKLTVDEENVKKHDLLYRLTPERYAAIKEEIESRLYTEACANQDYLDAAWNSAVKNMETLLQSIAAQSSLGMTCTVQVQPLAAVAESPLETVTP